MAGADGYEVKPSTLRSFASVISEQVPLLQRANSALTGVHVPSSAFGKLPESGDLCAAYESHANAEITNTAELPELFGQVSGALDATADHYSDAELANLEAALSVGPTGSGGPGAGGSGGGKGVGDYAVEAYQWLNTPLINWPIHLPDIHQMESNAIDGAIDSAVRGILDAVGLMSILDRVTGNPGLLHAAGQTWLDQANGVKQVRTDLATGAKNLPQQWKGGASAAFGAFMGNVASSTQSMGADMVTTAQILNDAGQECQMAQDMVVMIIREAAEWAAMTLAATALADIFTLGLASIAGGIAESAEMAAFVARATEVSVKLGEALTQLVEKIKELKGAAEAVKSAEGITDKLREFSEARKTINEIRNSGSILKAGNALKDPFDYAWRFGFSKGFSALRGGSAAALAGITGLPSGAGKFGLPPDIVQGGEGIITDDGNMNTDAGILDKLTGTGPNFVSPYHTSVSEIIDRTSTLDEPPPKPG
jgi:hypothetical protein